MKVSRVPITRVKFIQNPTLKTDIDDLNKDASLPESLWEIDQILDADGKEGDYSYRVRWKGYDKEYDSWIKGSDLKADILLKAFWDSRDGKEIKAKPNNVRNRPTEIITTSDDPRFIQQWRKAEWDCYKDPEDLQTKTRTRSGK